jgi:23S rRNA (cytidine1920-2'-O)/16S rRNA (cytidine1409-2'-O)-methyltransferase
MSSGPEPHYASRAGLKLHAALAAFGIDPAGLTCADLGCSTGGFTDCLLQHEAKHVYAVDTAYGELAWKLRQDPRVTALERSNALHTEPLAACELVTVDLGWTPQRLAIPAAGRWLSDDPSARIISLVKPHYEASDLARGGRHKGKLDDAQAALIAEQTLQSLEALGYQTLNQISSPIRGGKGGNLEFLVLLRAGQTPAQ